MPLEYELIREKEAKRLGLRVSVLDEEVRKHGKTADVDVPKFLEPPVPWPGSVDGDVLLTEIVKTLKRYVILPEHAAAAIALWILLAHAFECFDISPILAIESPEKRCGKTTLLALLQLLVPKPLSASNLTSATAFRAVETFKPTLLIDEADTFLKANNPELVGILNSGHARAGAFVVRTVGDNYDVKQFTTWCPKAIALIGELPPTLQDRAIAVQMRRRQQHEVVERRRADRGEPLRVLCRKAARWAADHVAMLKDCDPNVPPQLDDRAADNWRPLLAIAEHIGGSWRAHAYETSLALSGPRADQEETGGVRLLADCRDIFKVTDWLTPTGRGALVGVASWQADLDPRHRSVAQAVRNKFSADSRPR